MNPFIGEIIMFGGNFAPRGWALCDGQLMPISQWSALFSILGTTYGGDGRTTFGLPGMRGRVPVHAGSGPGLSTYRLGQRSGVEAVTLTTQQMPSHNHFIAGSEEDGSSNEANGHYLATSTSGNIYHNSASSNVFLAQNNVTNTGGNQAHTNIQPYCVVNFIIALQGVYPSRN
jgi:microcystin-dependent protein